METTTISIVSFLFALALVCWGISYIFTADKNDKSVMKPIANKRWKTFLIFFISYCLIFFIIYLFQR